MATNKRIWASHAISDKRVAISVGELHHEDPFSMLLLYDEDFEGLWGFVELPRTVVSITSIWSDEAGKDIFVAMSDEGDVYFIVGEVPVEKIPGAGVLSDDAEGLGAMGFITNNGGDLLACGDGSQIYRRIEAKAWVRLCDQSHPEVGANSFAACTFIGDNAAACGFSRSQFREPTEAELADLERVRQSGDRLKYKQLRREARRFTKRAGGCLVFSDGESWRSVELPNRSYLHGLLPIESGEVIAVGSDGTILRGSASGVEDLSMADDETLNAIRSTDQGPLILGESAVVVLAHDLTQIERIPLPDNLRQPQGFDAVEGVIWYFDHQGLARYRDGKWQQIEIPQDLWDRK